MYTSLPTPPVYLHPTSLPTPRNVWRNSPESLATFPKIFCEIHRDVLGYSPEILAIFPGMFDNNPRNI